MVDEAVILTQTVREWFPRFLANGVDYNVAVAITGRVREWGRWCEEWSREARRYEALGEEALDEGRAFRIHPDARKPRMRRHNDHRPNLLPIRFSAGWMMAALFALITIEGAPSMAQGREAAVVIGVSRFDVRRMPGGKFKVAPGRGLTWTFRPGESKTTPWGELRGHHT